MYVYMYRNVAKNTTVRVPHPWIRDSKDQETFLPPSANNQSQCSNQHHSLSVHRSIYR